MNTLTKPHKAAVVPNAVPTPSQFGWPLFAFVTADAERAKAKKAQDYKCINIPQGYTTKHSLTSIKSGKKKKKPQRKPQMNAMMK